MGTEKRILIKQFFVKPIGKPRMTRADRWRKRKCVEDYWIYKNQIRQQCENFIMPESNYWIVFHLPMPQSWNQKKKLQMDGQPHRQKPDKDNLEKAFLDAICKNDAIIWDGRITKLWAKEGRIDIYKIV